MRAIALLHLRRVRRHPLRAAIAVVAVASGVALSVTVSIVQTSTARSFESYARSFSGPAPLRVVGPVDRGGLPVSSIERVRDVPGVRAAVPLIQAVTLADGRSGSDIPVVALGFDCSVEELVGDFACSDEALTAENAPSMILSRTLWRALGPSGVVRSNDGAQSVRRAVVAEGLDDVNEGRVAAFPMAAAQRLFTRLGAVDSIYVFPTEGTDVRALAQRVQRELGDHVNVLEQGEPSPGLGFFTQLYIPLMAIGLGTLATGAVLAHNALALSIEERRRDLAVAAALGGRMRTIAGGALAEGAALGLLGGILGALVGLAVAHPVLAGYQFLTERAAGLTMTVHVTPRPLITGAVLGVLLGLIAAIRPSRRVSRLNVVAELHGRTPPVERSRLSLGRPAVLVAVVVLGSIGAAVASRDAALAPWQPLVAQPAAIVTILAAVIAIGQFAPHVFALAARVSRRWWPSARLACANLAGEGWRSASMVLAAGTAVLAGFMIANIGKTVLDSTGVAIERDIRSGVNVSTVPRSNSSLLDGKPSPNLIRRIGEVPGVGSVSRSAGLTVSTVADGTLAVEAYEGRTPTYRPIRGRVDPRAFERGEVVIGPALARQRGITPGDRLRLPGRDGYVDVPVQAIVENGDTTGLEVTMPLWQLERIWGPQPPVSLTVEPQPGVTPSEIAERIEAAQLDPHLEALAGRDFAADLRSENERFFGPFWVLQRALIAIAFAAVLSNLLLVALRRRREVGLVAAVGMTPRQLAGMVATEGLAIGVVATVLGSLAALAATEAFRRVMYVMIPYPMPLRIDVAAPFAYGGITIVVLLVAASLPAWRTARLNVIEALRYE